MSDKQMIEELQAEQSMFVQTAPGMASDATSLTLEGVTPSTLYFSDRPQRIVGHMSTADFVDLWAEGDNSFEEDPPNAVLAFLEKYARITVADRGRTLADIALIRAGKLPAWAQPPAPQS